MKLIVGLGNPGEEYKNTRHNVGFMAIDKLLSYYNEDCSKLKFGGMYTSFVVNGEKIMLLKPQKFINLSGEVLKRYIDFFKIDVDDVLVISDDLDLNIGKFKLKKQGSSGGHNGLKNIQKMLGTNNYKRLKIGISNDKNVDTKDYVLGTMSSLEKKEINLILDIVPSIVEDFIKFDFEKVMSLYNKK